MEKIKRTFSDYWQIIIAIALVIFNVGYTVKALEDKPSKDEVKTEITIAIEKYKIDAKESYIRMDQVPGLNEHLKAIYDKLAEIKDELRSRKQ